MIKPKVNQEYLGDGVYCEFDGMGLALRANDHQAPIAIYLEPEVLAELVGYARRVNKGVQGGAFWGTRGEMTLSPRHQQILDTVEHYNDREAEFLRGLASQIETDEDGNYLVIHDWAGAYDRTQLVVMLVEIAEMIEREHAGEKAK